MVDISRIFGPLNAHPRGWGRGIVVTRVWNGDFSQSDYARLLSGQRHWTGEPDAWTRDGVPVFSHSEERMRDIQQTLDRLCTATQSVENVACNGGRSNALNYLGNVVDNGVRYFSVGTGTGTFAATNTTMFADFFRKSPTSVTLVGNQILISTNFAAGEGNTTYTEAGLIGGSTAVVTVGGAGTLFTHAPFSYTKTSLISLTTDYYLYLT